MPPSIAYRTESLYIRHKTHSQYLHKFPGCCSRTVLPKSACRFVSQESEPEWQDNASNKRTFCMLHPDGIIVTKPLYHLVSTVADWVEVLFELKCSISPQNCYLTFTGGHARRVGLDLGYQEELAASYWLQPPVNASAVDLSEWVYIMAHL